MKAVDMVISELIDSRKSNATSAVSTTFHPEEPATLESSGLSEAIVDSLIGKYLLSVHSSQGRQIARSIHLPFSIIEKRLTGLKTRRLVTSTNVSAFGDFTFQLTDEGHRQAKQWLDACSYVGPAPVPLEQYVESVAAQSIRNDSVSRESIARAFQSLSVDASLFSRIGPAIRTGAGLFFYGQPGNGKTSIAERIARSFSSTIWIPHALIVSDCIIKVYDPAYHQPVETAKTQSVLRETSDLRWLRIERPTVIAGGELTMDSLEIRHDPSTNISEAPLQLKANGGVLVIDDFGRQRISPADLLNRWIVPLDRKYDLLTLFTGNRFAVPFDLLAVFSTNIEPKDLVDEAFLRRIPYKISVDDPTEEEFQKIFRSVAESHGFTFCEHAVKQLIKQHYQLAERSFRRCHPRDLLAQLTAYIDFHDLERELRGDWLSHVAQDYFLS